ncbi:retrovirus-related pol polyprotein from transposon TNT 1-94, partial [Tanacetum coccineum]
KGIRVYKFNLDYVASMKWVVELSFNVRLLSSTSISFSCLVNLLEVKHFISTSVKEIDIIQLGIVSQAGLKLLLRSSSVSASPHKLKLKGSGTEPNTKDCRHNKVHEGGNTRGNSNQANHMESLKEFVGVIESFLTTMLLIGGLIQVPQSTSAIQEGCLYLTKSKFCYVYLINTKDEALNMFKTYKAEFENQLDKKIKILRSNRGVEYESNDFAEFCSTFGIVHQITAPYTPQQNGVAARKNRTLKNMINSILITSGSPHSLWGKACLAANTILNKIPHKKSDKCPHKLWKGKQPSYKRMKVWGCLAKVQIPLPKRTKFGPKMVDCVYLGPAKNSAAYRFLVYKSNVEDISNNTIIESAEAEFFKNTFPYEDKDKQISNPRKRVLDDELSQDQRDNTSEVPQENAEPRRSKHAKVNKNFKPDYMTYIVNEEPQTYKAAME